MTQDHDPFITQMLQSTALRLHDAEACEDRVSEMAPESPDIADEENITPDERDAIRQYLAASEAHSSQLDAARADHADARRAHAQAYRLATGHDIGEDGAAVMQHLVGVRGAAEVLKSFHVQPPPAPVNVAPPPIARHGRPREAGRAARRSTRSSAASGDSGDGPEPPAASAARGSDER